MSTPNITVNGKPLDAYLKACEVLHAKVDDAHRAREVQSFLAKEINWMRKVGLK